MATEDQQTLDPTLSRYPLPDGIFDRIHQDARSMGRTTDPTGNRLFMPDIGLHEAIDEILRREGHTFADFSKVDVRDQALGLGTSEEMEGTISFLTTQAAKLYDALQDVYPLLDMRHNDNCNYRYNPSVLAALMTALTAPSQASASSTFTTQGGFNMGDYFCERMGFDRVLFGASGTMVNRVGARMAIEYLSPDDIIICTGDTHDSLQRTLREMGRCCLIDPKIFKRSRGRVEDQHISPLKTPLIPQAIYDGEVFDHPYRNRLIVLPPGSEALIPDILRRAHKNGVSGWVITESVFSAAGRQPWCRTLIDEFTSAAIESNFGLILDDSHGAGIARPNFTDLFGREITNRFQIRTGSGAKILGGFGASWLGITLPPHQIESVYDVAQRREVFTSGQDDHRVAVVAASLRYAEETEYRAPKLAALNSEYFRSLCRSFGLDCISSFPAMPNTPFLGNASMTIRILNRMAREGHLVAAGFVPPATPLNETGGRFTLKSTSTPQSIEFMVRTLTRSILHDFIETLRGDDPILHSIDKGARIASDIDKNLPYYNPNVLRFVLFHIIQSGLLGDSEEIILGDVVSTDLREAIRGMQEPSYQDLQAWSEAWHESSRGKDVSNHPIWLQERKRNAALDDIFHQLNKCLIPWGRLLVSTQSELNSGADLAQESSAAVFSEFLRHFTPPEIENYVDFRARNSMTPDLSSVTEA